MLNVKVKMERKKLEVTDTQMAKWQDALITKLGK